MFKKTRKQKNLMRVARHFIQIHLNGQEYFDKISVYYNQVTWCKHFKKYCGYDIGRRQLNYIFADLEKAKIAVRYQRHRKDPIRGYEFRSTRIYMGIAAWYIALNYRLAPIDQCFKMINAIKKGGQAVINKVKEWATPEWMKDMNNGKSYTPKINKDIPDLLKLQTKEEIDAWYVKYG